MFATMRMTAIGSLRLANYVGHFEVYDRVHFVHDRPLADDRRRWQQTPQGVRFISPCRNESAEWLDISAMIQQSYEPYGEIVRLPAAQGRLASILRMACA